MASMAGWSLLGVAFTFTLAGSAAAADTRLIDNVALRRSDGSQIIAYVDRQGVNKRQGVLMLAQGSGCGSVLRNTNIAEAKRRLLSDFAIITVEDYGVSPNDPDKLLTEKCTDAYYKHHTISQRVSDYRQALAVIERQPWWDGRLAMFGGSEGGAVVQELAPLVAARAVVVYSSATGIPFRDAVVQVLPPPVAKEAATQFAAVRRDPAGPGLLLGNSHLWWADIMDRRLSDDLLKADEPILVVQGERDESNPVMSARAVRDTFASLSKTNLTYWEYAGYDHHMRDKSGIDHFDEVMSRISDWMKANLNDRATR